MAQQFVSVRDAMSVVDGMALGQIICVGGRYAEVVRGSMGKTIQFKTQTYVDFVAAYAPSDRRYNKAANGSKSIATEE